MAATRPGQVLGDRGRVGGVVEDQQPPRPLPQRIPGPGGQLGRRQLRRQPQRDPEVGQGGHHAQLGLGRHPPAERVVAPVALGIGQGQLGLAHPAHAIQRRGRDQRRRALAGQLVRRAASCSSRPVKERTGGGIVHPRPAGTVGSPATGWWLGELVGDGYADLLGQLVGGGEEAHQPLAAQLLPQRPDAPAAVAVPGERPSRSPAREPPGRAGTPDRACPGPGRGGTPAR